MTVTEVAIALLPLLLAVALVMVVVGNSGTYRAQLHRLRRQQTEIDAKLDAVIEHLGISLPMPEYPDVERFLVEGDVVRAVKAYRDESGAGLIEAKHAVDEIARRRGLPPR